MNQSDKELYLNIKAGDTDAFDKAFKRYYPALVAFATQYVSPADAENIVQDVMLWFWENRETVSIQSSLNTYLFTAVKNRCFTMINRGQIRQRVVDSIRQSMGEHFESPDFYIVDDLVAHLEQALQGLPPTFRQAFEMNRFYDKCYKEIASELNISPKTVDYRIQQALKRLRISLKDYLPLLALFL